MGLGSRLRRVGGPVGVRAGRCMGGGLEAGGCGEEGRCLGPQGEGGRTRGLCLAGPGDGVLLPVAEGEGEGDRRRPGTLEGEDGRFQPGEENRFSGFCVASVAPSEDVEPLRSVLLLRRGPLGGCRGLAEAERGQR